MTIETLRAKSILRAATAPDHIGLPDVCCDIYWWEGRLQFAGPMTAASPPPFAGRRATIVCLDPLVAGAWLGVPLGELTDRVVDLADIDRRRASALTAAFETGATVGLGVPPEDVPQGDPRVRIAADLLRLGRTVAQVARRLDLSQRQFERIFFSHTGLTPREFTGITRFRRAVFAAKRGFDLSQAAGMAGYADQSHLTRDSTRLTGRSPKKLLPHVGNVQDLVHGNWE